MLEYFLTSNETDRTQRINTRGGSDHNPIYISMKITQIPKTNKNYVLSAPNRYPTEMQIKNLMESGWPLELPKSNTDLTKHQIILFKFKFDLNINKLKLNIQVHNLNFK